MKNKQVLMLSGILGLQSGIFNFNPESSRVVNILSKHNPESHVESLVNTNPESKATDIINTHPLGVKVACAMWAKGVCIAVKAAKYAASSTTESQATTRSGVMK